MADEKVTTNPMEKMRLRMAAEGYNTLPPDFENTDKDSAMKKRSSEWSRTEKQLLVLLIICLIVVLLLAVLLVVNFFILRQKEVCDDVNCVEVSGSVIRYMNFSVNPCDNFYEYACGNFETIMTIPPDKPKYSQFSVIADKNSADLKRLLDAEGSKLNGVSTPVVTKAKQYYQACMNMTATDDRGIEPLMEIIKNMGSWTLTSGDSGTWIENTWDLQETIIKANRHGIDPFYSFGVGVDDKDSNMQLIVFDQSGLSFKRDHYLDEEKTIYRTVFIEYFSAIVELLGGSAADAKIRAGEIFDFEAKLAKEQISKEERRDQEKMYHKMTVADVQETIGSWVDLSVILTAFFEEEVPDNEAVIHYVPSYYEKLQDMVTDQMRQKKEVIVDYVMWHVISAYTGLLPSQFREASLILTRALSGVDTLPQRWISCVGRTEGTFPYVTGAMFVENRFSSEEKEKVEGLLQHIINEFGENLPTISWMDDTTKERAINKLNALGHKIGYPDITQDINKLEDYYSEIVVTSDNQFANAQSVLQYSLKKAREHRGKPPDKWEWGMAAETVNAYYSSTLNEMVFPAGILKRPFYDARFPNALNFGAIGMVMGHELSHGFDDQGRQFDKDGNLQNWWEKQSLNNFKSKTGCISEQYSEFVVQGLKVNGAFTLGENIADNGGLKTAYKAYKRWLEDKGESGHEPKAYLPGLELTEDQLFFLGFAQIWCFFDTPAYAKKAIVEDPHSPADVRVLGTLHNMKEFAEAYECSSNAPMNPEHKCEVW